MTAATRHTSAALMVAGAMICAVAGHLLVRVDPVFIAGALVAVGCAALVMSRPYIGLLLYTVVFMVRPGELVPALAPLRLERIVGLLCLAGMFYSQFVATGRLAIDRSRQSRYLFLFVAVCACSLPFAYWRSEAIKEYQEVLKSVVFYVLVAHLVTSPRRLSIFLVVYLAMVTYIAGDAFRSYLAGDFKYAQGIDRAVGSTSAGGDPNHLGTTMAATLPLVLYLIQAVRKPIAIGLCSIAGLTMIATQAVTGSRASLAGLLAGLIAMWLRSRRRALYGSLGLLVLAAAFVLLPEQYQVRYSSMTESEVDASSQGRLDAWKAGLRMAADRPVTGVGIGCFSTAYALGYSPEFHRNWLQSHSLYVQLLAETGVAGFLLFLAFISQALRTTREGERELGTTADGAVSRAVLRGVFVGLVVLLVSGIFGHSLLRRTWYVYAGLSLAVLRLRSIDSNEEARTP